MTRRGLFLALDHIARRAGYSDDDELDVGIGMLIVVVLFGSLLVSATMYPYFGVIVP